MWKVIFICIAVTFEVLPIHARLFQDQPEYDYAHVYDRQRERSSHKRSQRDIRYKASRNEDWKSELGGDNIKGTEHILEDDSNNIAFVFWKHHQTDVIFILTCQTANTTSLGKLSNKGCHTYSNFYKSESLGASFNRSDKVAPFTNHWLHSIYLSPVNKAFIIITDYHNNTLFTTNNEGTSYETIKLGFSPTYIEFHPNKTEVIAAFDNTKGGKQSLWLSQNKGKAWQLVSNNVKNYFWQNEQMGVSSNGIYFERLEVHEDRVEGKLVSSICHYPFPRNNAMQPVLRKLYGIVQDSVYIGHEFVVAQKMSDMHLYVMRPKFDPIFRKVVYKYKNSKPHLHHTILNSENNELILAVFNPDTTVTLYLSDATGQFFYFINENIIAEPLTDAGKVPKIDFYRVKGFINSYIINRKDNGTLISYDKGYSWNALSYDTKGFNGRPIDADCKLNGGECRLNLFLKVEVFYSDYTAPLLSKDSAPGIILAQGRIGGVLTKHEDLAKHDVYISTDGGRKWRQTLGSLYSYALLDHGNAIAATPLRYTVHQDIMVTTNFGYHWYNFPLTDRYSRIAAIITDSTAKTLIVNVFGFLHQQPEGSDVSSNQWVLWKFNFTNLIPRVCKEDDYYRYYPFVDKCVLGEKYSYIQSLRHKNQTATCYSPADYDLKPQRDACSCTKLDYDCEDDYVKVLVGELSYNCKPLSDHQIQKQQCDKSGYYIKTKGYRKRHGNKCTGGVERDLSGTKEKCDSILPIVKIHASLLVVGLNEPVQLSIKHKTNTYGSKYTWYFGDGIVKTGSITEIENVEHSYHYIGHFKVELVGQNVHGSYTDSLLIVVLDKTYHHAFIDFEAPLIVNQKNKFMLRKLKQDGESKAELPHQKNIRFLWSFKGVYVGGTNFVEVPYTFDTTGIFQVEVQVISPVNAQTILRIVRVYKEAYAVDFTFSSRLNSVNTQTQTWTNDFMYKFKNFIRVRYNIDDTDERLVVQANNTLPTRVRLTICDSDNTSNRVDYKRAETLVNEITEDINTNKPLLGGYQILDVHVLSARPTGLVKHTITDSGTTRSGHTKVWVYVVVMLVAVLIVIASAIIYRHRGKKTSWFKVRKDRDDIMQKKLVFHADADEDCVGLEGPDLPQYKD